MYSTQIVADGQGSQTLQQLTQRIAKRLPNKCKSKKNLRTFQPENRGIFKNSQLQINFTGSDKKECISTTHGNIHPNRVRYIDTKNNTM